MASYESPSVIVFEPEKPASDPNADPSIIPRIRTMQQSDALAEL